MSHNQPQPPLIYALTPPALPSQVHSGIQCDFIKSKAVGRDKKKKLGIVAEDTQLLLFRSAMRKNHQT